MLNSDLRDEFLILRDKFLILANTDFYKLNIKNPNLNLSHDEVRTLSKIKNTCKFLFRKEQEDFSEGEIDILSKQICTDLKNKEVGKLINNSKLVTPTKDVLGVVGAIEAIRNIQNSHQRKRAASSSEEEQSPKRMRSSPSSLTSMNLSPASTFLSELSIQVQGENSPGLFALSDEEERTVASMIYSQYQIDAFEESPGTSNEANSSPEELEIEIQLEGENSPGLFALSDEEERIVTSMIYSQYEIDGFEESPGTSNKGISDDEAKEVQHMIDLWVAASSPEEELEAPDTDGTLYF